jgi:ribosome biogenesis GTPase / thiamine phosphate phosphatase
VWWWNRPKDPDDPWTIEASRADQRARPPRARQGARPKVIVANVDRVVIVFAAPPRSASAYARPLPRPLREQRRWTLLVVANKVDLVGLEAAREDAFGVYESIGYEVMYHLGATGEGSMLCVRRCAPGSRR